MGTILEIILGLMILASFFVAYMSARTWAIYQVVLIEFIFLAAVAFFYLAGRTLATEKAWRTLVNQREKELADVERQSQELREGGAPDETGQPSKGIAQLKQDLAKLALDRGGVMYDVAVDSVKDGEVQLKFKSANHGLVANSVLFVFDQKPATDGGRYLGEFKVASVAEEPPGVQIAENLPLTKTQSERLAQAKGPLTLYTTMPVDTLTLPAIPKVTPRSTEPGQGPAEAPPPADPNAPPDAQAAPGQPPPGQPEAAPPVAVASEAVPAEQLPERPLRDYEYLFHENYVQRSLLADQISEITSNIQRTNADTEETNREIEFRNGEKENLSGDLEKFSHELKALLAYEQTLSKHFAGLRGALRKTYLANREKAAELTARQLRAAQEISARAAMRASAQNEAVALP